MSARIKAAYIIPYLQKSSGWRNHSIAFLNAIHQFVDPVLFVSAADTAAARSLFPEFPIFTLPVTQAAPLSSRSGLMLLSASYWRIQRDQYPAVDLVHSLEAYPTGLVGHWLARKLGRPHLITVHGTYGVIWQGFRLDRHVYRRVLAQAGMVCPVSHGTAELMQQYFGPALARTLVRPILNGNDYYKNIQADAAMQRTLPQIPTLLTVGDVKPRKGQHVSLEAFAQVKSQLPAARYRILGHYRDNAYFRSLQALIEKHNLQDVEFLGRVSDDELRRQYNEASLFVMTPQQEGLHFEGFGLVYLEAGAYGLPVVASRSGGVPDAVRDGETGLICEEGDPAGAARAMLRILTDPQLASRMGRANRRWAETLTWERCADAYLQAYQALIGGASR